MCTTPSKAWDFGQNRLCVAYLNVFRAIMPGSVVGIGDDMHGANEQMTGSSDTSTTSTIHPLVIPNRVIVKGFGRGQGLAYCWDLDLVAVPSDSNRVKLFRLDLGKLTYVHTLSTWPDQGIAFNFDKCSQQVAFTPGPHPLLVVPDSLSHAVHLVHCGPAKGLFEHGGFVVPVGVLQRPKSAAVSPCGARMAISTCSRRVVLCVGGGHLWTLTRDIAYDTLTKPLWAPTGLGFSVDGSQLCVTDNRKGTIVLLSADTGVQLADLGCCLHEEPLVVEHHPPAWVVVCRGGGGPGTVQALLPDATTVLCRQMDNPVGRTSLPGLCLTRVCDGYRILVDMSEDVFRMSTMSDLRTAWMSAVYKAFLTDSRRRSWDVFP